MKTWPVLALLALVIALPPHAHAQVAPDRTLSSFSVVNGLDLSLFASEPLFVNPTCMDIDHRGRVWVCESVNYRNRLHNAKKLNRPEGDRIVILEDTDGDGKADKATTFYQDPNFIAPLGIAVAKDPVGPGYKVYVCHSPHIYVFEDKDGDGKADGPPKILFTGFGGYDHDHGVHGILIGPDMKLYFSIGDQGVKGLQSSDGKGRKWTSNATDCRAGTIWRCDLDGKNLELVAHNFRNEYEPCVDSFGTIFVSDNDDDGNQQTRICYVMPGGNYGYNPRGPGQTHWHEEQPGVVPKILRTYFGSPTGMCVYEGTLLPKKYWGQLLHTDAGPRHLRCYHLKSKGAGYEVEREDMVTSGDSWFRPSDVCVAPDGSVFIADWYDPGVGGHGMGDTTRGRIYRVTPTGHKGYKVPKVDLQSAEGTLAALESPNLAVRYMAMARIRGIAVKPISNGDQQSAVFSEPTTDTDKAIVAALKQAATNGTSRTLRARALWQLGALTRRMPVNGPMLSGLNDKDPEIRMVCFRVLKEAVGFVAADRTEEGLHEAAREPSPVRRELLLLSCNERIVPLDQSKRLIYALAKQYDGNDRFYLEAIGIAVGHHDEKRREFILADFDKHFPEWNEKVADLVWELRPPSALAQLPQRLVDPGLSVASRARIVDILATSDDVNAGRALLKVFQQDVPAEVKAKVVANLKLFLPGKWQALRNGPEVEDTIRVMLARRETVTAALALIGSAEKMEHLAEVAGFTDDRDPAVRQAAVDCLAALPSARATAVLARLLASSGPERRLDIVKALGSMAQNPPNRPASIAAMKVLEDMLLAGGDPACRQRALVSLIGTRPGSVWLLNLQAEGKLADDLKPEAARQLRNTPYKGLRAQVMLVFPPSGRLDRNSLPSAAALAGRKGDTERGRRVMAASLKNDMQCLKCHQINGQGGQIGPDLSVIGKKASRENLFESILFPSKAIADQFITWQIETGKGLVLNGLIVEETADALTLRDANGKDHKIAKSDIETRAKSPKSLMPDDLPMTETELVDLVEYLFSLK